MAKNYWIIAVLLFSILFLIGLKSNLPMTNNEVREGYTAFSILKTGKDTNGSFMPLFFRADNNYLSTLGIYFRIPVISIFGLNNFGVRFAGLFVGIIDIILFYFVASRLLKNKTEVFTAIILFTVSPIFFQTTLLNLGLASTFGLFLLTILFCVQNKRPSKKFIYSLAAVVILAGIYVIKFQPQLFGFIKRESVIQNVLPSYYSFQFAKRLSFDQICGSPFIIGKTNFNRIVFNKYFYGVNSVLQSFISPFNFEKIVSPLQSQTVLSKETFYSRYLTQLYFWEIPVIVVGLTFYLKRKERKIPFLLSGLVIFYFFSNSLIFLLPAFAILESICFVFVFERLKGNSRWLFIIGLTSLYMLGAFVINDLFLNHPELWLDENSLRQSQIWSKISQADLDNNKIFVTDRLGEPVFYYLYYKQIDPQKFLKARINGALLNGEIQRTDSVGNVFFGSFKYYDLPKAANELWVGFPGEFTRSGDVAGGVVINKIEHVSVIDGKTIGDQIWFVKN